MPYAVDVWQLDQQGIVFNLANFLRREISKLPTSLRAAMPQRTPVRPCSAVQMAVNVPSTVHVAQLRDEFLELCDRLNLDAILSQPNPDNALITLENRIERTPHEPSRRATSQQTQRATRRSA